MKDKIIKKLKALNKDMSEEKILELRYAKIYFCPGGYELLPEEERRKKIEKRDKNYQKFLKEQNKKHFKSKKHH